MRKGAAAVRAICEQITLVQADALYSAPKELHTKAWISLLSSLLLCCQEYLIDEGEPASFKLICKICRILALIACDEKSSVGRGILRQEDVLGLLKAALDARAADWTIQVASRLVAHLRVMRQNSLAPKNLLENRKAAQRAENGDVILYVDKWGWTLKSFDDDGVEDDVVLANNRIYCWKRVVEENKTMASTCSLPPYIHIDREAFTALLRPDSAKQVVRAIQIRCPEEQAEEFENIVKLRLAGKSVICGGLRQLPHRKRSSQGEAGTLVTPRAKAYGSATPLPANASQVSVSNKAPERANMSSIQSASQRLLGDDHTNLSSPTVVIKKRDSRQRSHTPAPSSFRGRSQSQAELEAQRASNALDDEELSSMSDVGDTSSPTSHASVGSRDPQEISNPPQANQAVPSGPEVPPTFVPNRRSKVQPSSPSISSDKPVTRSRPPSARRTKGPLPVIKEVMIAKDRSPSAVDEPQAVDQNRVVQVPSTAMSADSIHTADTAIAVEASRVKDDDPPARAAENINEEELEDTDGTVVETPLPIPSQRLPQVLITATARSNRTYKKAPSKGPSTRESETETDGSATEGQVVVASDSEEESPEWTPRRRSPPRKGFKPLLPRDVSMKVAPKPKKELPKKSSAASTAHGKRPDKRQAANTSKQSVVDSHVHPATTDGQSSEDNSSHDGETTDRLIDKSKAGSASQRKSRPSLLERGRPDNEIPLPASRPASITTKSRRVKDVNVGDTGHSTHVTHGPVVHPPPTPADDQVEDTPTIFSKPRMQEVEDSTSNDNSEAQSATSGRKGPGRPSIAVMKEDGEKESSPISEPTTDIGVLPDFVDEDTGPSSPKSTRIGNKRSKEASPYAESSEQEEQHSPQRSKKRRVTLQDRRTKAVRPVVELRTRQPPKSKPVALAASNSSRKAGPNSKSREVPILDLASPTPVERSPQPTLEPVTQYHAEISAPVHEASEIVAVVIRKETTIPSLPSSPVEIPLGESTPIFHPVLTTPDVEKPSTYKKSASSKDTKISKKSQLPRRQSADEVDDVGQVLHQIADFMSEQLRRRSMRLPVKNAAVRAQLAQLELQHVNEVLAQIHPIHKHIWALISSPHAMVEEIKQDCARLPTTFAELQKVSASCEKSIKQTFKFTIPVLFEGFHDKLNVSQSYEVCDVNISVRVKENERELYRRQGWYSEASDTHRSTAASRQLLVLARKCIR
ncbi:hypothetical protein TREMEDRAFT_60198 [Tremella mesenterica DSM 1558]|uniref:uncharacterized protein n=1 Tax=Tremella mesenterica (strain ATCC 24925 / CBS 8224 / DSM 1558 / NBRC 9311 / NRRL Y-6157 / RJB 2259-6 / UBC 559-6) TaxID=578456 RepID=UPI0003F49185|nr:uncharacterized protein TREMEDRAFT_60198 [Tremella mesenterica DSM 1558]EIW71267.1 hypothetical protein TREMEDRAFT_60198 [Tremella mesenterica DSM 1558]